VQSFLHNKQRVGHDDNDVQSERVRRGQRVFKELLKEPR